MRSSLAVISMAAMKQPHLVAERLDLLLKVYIADEFQDKMNMFEQQAFPALNHLQAWYLRV